MSLDLFAGSTLSLLERTVSFTQQRHGVLAGNIANLDTPGYQARDLSVDAFQQRLQETIEAARQARETGRRYGESQEAAGRGRGDGLAGAKDDYKTILRHDGNTTGLEEQVTEIAKNQAQHNLALSLMNAQFRMLRVAVTERA